MRLISHQHCESCIHKNTDMLTEPCVSCCEGSSHHEVAEYGVSNYERDQTAKADEGKPRLTLVPRGIIWAIEAIRSYGCRKYPSGGAENWRQVEPERYRDALLRHLFAYLDDPKGLDAESGYPHLWHVATNVAFLIELEETQKTGGSNHEEMSN